MQRRNIPPALYNERKLKEGQRQNRRLNATSRLAHRRVALSQIETNRTITLASTSVSQLPSNAATNQSNSTCQLSSFPTTSQSNLTTNSQSAPLELGLDGQISVPPNCEVRGNIFLRS